MELGGVERIGKGREKGGMWKKKLGKNGGGRKWKGKG